MQFWRSRMFRKKSCGCQLAERRVGRIRRKGKGAGCTLESSFTGFTVGAGAIGGPLGLYSKLDVRAMGGAGCRARKEGMKTPSSRIAKGKTLRREGSRHINVYTNNRLTVCDHFRQLRRRITRAWKTNITPMRELKRRKFVLIVGSEKLGFSTMPR